jgi:LemA protein
MVNRKRTIGKIIAGIIIVLIIIGGWLSYSYNDLVNARNDVETRYSQVDNVLQRRADLIPPMIDTVKASMKQEQATLTTLEEARSLYEDADKYEKPDASDSITKASDDLVKVIRESYPELKTNTTVKNFMIDVQGSENRISYEKIKYNRAVESYDNKVEAFPESIAAGIFGFKPIRH